MMESRNAPSKFSALNERQHKQQQKNTIAAKAAAINKAVKQQQPKKQQKNINAAKSAAATQRKQNKENKKGNNIASIKQQWNALPAPQKRNFFNKGSNNARTQVIQQPTDVVSNANLSLPIPTKIVC